MRVVQRGDTWESKGLPSRGQGGKEVIGQVLKFCCQLSFHPGLPMRWLPQPNPSRAVPDVSEPLGFIVSPMSLRWRRWPAIPIRWTPSGFVSGRPSCGLRNRRRNSSRVWLQAEVFSCLGGCHSRQMPHVVQDASPFALPAPVRRSVFHGGRSQCGLHPCG